MWQGAAVARELYRLDLAVLVLEAGNDIAYGATRANSAIVHAGFDPEAGGFKRDSTSRVRDFSLNGPASWAFPYKRNGSLVLGFTAGMMRCFARSFGVGPFATAWRMSALSGEQVRLLEPSVNPDARCALLAEAGAIATPYQVALRCAEQAAQWRSVSVQ